MRATTSPLPSALLHLASAAALVAGCATPADSVAPPAPRTALGVRLTLTPDPLEVRVTVRAPGEADGTTVFGVAESWGGVPPERADLFDVEARGADGRALAWAPAGAHGWSVTHAPGEEVELSASLRPNDLRGFDGRDHYRPLLEPGFLHAIGHLLLPMADTLPWDEEVPITLEFPGFREAGWDVVSSFGIAAPHQVVVATPGELRSALFVAGDLQLATRELTGGTLAVTTAAGGFAFDVVPFADLVARIVEVERELMREDDAPFYWVNAIPVGEANPQGFSFGGTGLTNCFALFLQPDAEIALDSRMGLPIRKLLAHECFHEWNGISIPLAQPEERCYWFSEGFTDYFARVVLHRAGWLDDAGYVASLNEALRRYHLSGPRNLPAEELGEAFWTDREAQDQPYLRGDVVAMVVDHAIRRASGGSDDLAGLLRDLVEEHARTGIRMDADLLLERIEARTDPATAQAVRGVVVGGATATLPADFAALLHDPGAYRVEETTLHRFELGFDLEASQPDMTLRGVLPGSAAAQAGLADGQEVAGWSIYWDDVEHDVEITLREASGGSGETIAYRPLGEPLTVPQLVPRTPDEPGH